MWKKLFYLILIVAAGTAIWFAFAIWVGLYSIYSYPPTKEDHLGSTLIIQRDEWEPMFNSPDYVPPKREDKPQGAGWSKTDYTMRRPISRRTIIKLPYIEWAYQKSLPEKANEKKPK